MDSSTEDEQVPVFLSLEENLTSPLETCIFLAFKDEKFSGCVFSMHEGLLAAFSAWNTPLIPAC